MNHIRKAFGEDADLYDILVLSRDDAEDPAKLRKCYFRQALKYHPDKQQGSASTADAALAKEKFQAVSLAYQVLKNPDKRAEYNETGHVDENNDYDDDDDDDSSNTAQKDWKMYFDRIFGKVTKSKIDEFSLKYKCSEEEQRDVLKEYKRWKGDLIKMLEYVMLSTPLDAKRWVEDYIFPAIRGRQNNNNDNGDIPDYTTTVEKSLQKLQKKIEKEQSKVSKKKCSNKKSTKENLKPPAANTENDDGSDEQHETSEDDDDVTETEDDDDEDISEAKPAAAAAASTPMTTSKRNATGKKLTATKAKPSKAKAPQKNKKGQDDDLFAMIQANQAQRTSASMFASLGARYGVDIMKDDDDKDPLCDDEFKNIQKGLQRNSKSKKRSRS